MDTSSPVYLDRGTPHQIQGVLQQSPADTHFLVLVAEGGEPDLQEINQTLYLSGYGYAGGLFPRIILGDRVYDQGLIMAPLATRFDPVAIDGLDTGVFNLRDLPDSITLQGQSLLILVDGLATHSADFLRRLYSRYGSKVVYLGGGAGSLSLQQQPCLFCAAGVVQGQALVIPLEGRVNLGVQHGWQRLMGPLIATEVTRNTITQINWQPAFTVYRDAIEPHSDQAFTKKNFFELARAYPFGVEKEGAEDIVRDPVAVTDDGALVCLGEVSENALIHILEGEPEQLVQAASRATQMAMQDQPGELRLKLVIDCVSRYLYLGNAFTEELQAIDSVFDSHDNDREAFGALTLGEISSIGDGLLELLNKSVVVGVLE